VEKVWGEAWGVASERHGNRPENRRCYEDVFTKINLWRQHYLENGLGEDFIDQFIR
jgi:hypothetical protein